MPDDKFKIMIVDDQPESVETFKFLFESLGGYAVEGFTRPEEALVYLRNRGSELPSAIIVDIAMPGMDGYRFGQEVRKDYRLCHIPFIYLSVKSEVPDKIEARNFTPHFFPKDGSREELLSLVKSVINEHIVQSGVNPLTGLPGNVIIEKTVNDVVKTQENYAIYYVDCDNFKAYNDVYGPFLGDQAIREIAKALDRSLREMTGGSYFIGHLGGDDFILLTWGAIGPEAVCHRVFEEVKVIHAAIHTEEDRKRNYFEGVNRRGIKEQFDLLSVSIGVVPSQVKRVSGWAEASNFLCEVKKKAKSQKGNTFCIDKRKK